MCFIFVQILDPEMFEHLQQNGDLTHFYFCYRWFLLDFKRGSCTEIHTVEVHLSFVRNILGRMLEAVELVSCNFAVACNTLFLFVFFFCFQNLFMMTFLWCGKLSGPRDTAPQNTLFFSSPSRCFSFTGNKFIFLFAERLLKFP